MSEIPDIGSLSLEPTPIDVFHARNDIHVYISDKLIFGFRNSEHMTFGNLFNALDAVLHFKSRPETRSLAPRNNGSPADAETLIAWNVANRLPISKETEYDVLLVLSSGQRSQIMNDGIAWRILWAPLRPRSKRSTPSTEAAIISPSGSGGRRHHVTVAGGQLSAGEKSGDGTSDRGARADRRGEGISSPKQHRIRAPRAPLRCWSVHQKCCITGVGGISGSKPKDIVSMHIWKHAYQNEWFANEYEKFCLDHGPPDVQYPQDYIGWHHICCLNNMASVRVDIHELLDAFEIGIDFNDGGRIISFSKERTYLSAHHYDVSHISPEQRPLEDLWHAQFIQCVLRHCLYPNASQQMLDASDGSDYMSSNDNTSITDAGWEELHLARLTLRDYENELENGSGKIAFENYLKLAL